MSEPEILDPEGPGGPGEGSAAASGVERLVELIQRQLPGRTVRVDVEARPPQAPRFRIEADGKGGMLVVQSGPLRTILVSFGGARFPFLLLPDADRAFAQIAERVRAIVAGELVVLEEQATPRLKRTTVFAAQGESLVRMVESGVEPGAAPAEARLSSFADAFNRAPTADERRTIRRLTGGLLGRLKRKVAEKILERAAGAVMGAVEQAATSAASSPDAHEGARTDDGRRNLTD